MAETEAEPLLGTAEEAREEQDQRHQSSEFKRCCKEMEFLEFRDKFVIRSVDPESPGHAFSVNRSDGVFEALQGDSNIGNPVKVLTFYGVLGAIRLLAGTYLLLITSRKEVTNRHGMPVFLVKSMKFIPCNKGLRDLTPQEKRDEAYFMTLLKTVEATPGLYYSYDVDLTLNLQRTCKLAKRRSRKPLWKQADPRFVWNRNLLEELIECKLDTFVIPVIQGSIQSIQVTIRSSPAKITLVSRRCTRRLGTRMWRRGANLEGDTANFIETEQLLEFEDFTSSFLQIRGSIPLLWEQIVDLSYKPRLNLLDHPETSKVVERHFHDLLQRYGETVAVDLTDKHGDEGQLSRAFAAEMEKLSNVRLLQSSFATLSVAAVKVMNTSCCCCCLPRGTSSLLSLYKEEEASPTGFLSFDFHHLCGNANFSGLELLYDQISDEIEKEGYFLLNAKGDILSEQKGIIRVNCIDCLDRTNVTQSYIARKSLNKQFEKMEAFSSSDCISNYFDIEEKFRSLWVYHGDEISLEYSGTHALKGDLVRYGRQTLPGLVKDGVSSLSRYYLNNFQDGIRQDALDLISGRYNISKNGPSPFQLNGFESLSYLPIASALIVGGLTITTFTLNQAGRSGQHFISSVFWAGLTAGVMAVVKANGRQFCSRPRLCNLL